MEINRILIASPIYEKFEKLLEDKVIFTEKEFRFRAMDQVEDEDYLWADCYVGFTRPPNFQFGNIKWIHSLGAGVDKLLKDVEWKESVLLTRTIGPFGKKMSEYCLSYLLAEFQNHSLYKEQQGKKEWKFSIPSNLNGKKVAVYGTGAIGQELARYLAFFGVEVYGVSLSGVDKPYFSKVISSEDESNFPLKEMDAVINTMPLTEKTHHFFAEKRFQEFQQVIFINVGRGESVNDEALLGAIERGNIKRAILDVFHEEPLQEEHPFWTHPQIQITPHISAVTDPESGLDCFLDTLKKVEIGNGLINAVDMKRGF